MVFEDNNPTPKLAADSSCRPRSHQNGLVCCCGHSHGEDIFALGRSAVIFAEQRHQVSEEER